MREIQVRAQSKNACILQIFGPKLSKVFSSTLKRITVECRLCNRWLMQGLQIIRAVLMMSCKDYPPLLISPLLLVSCPWSFAIPAPIKPFPGCCSSFPGPGLRLARPCPDFTRTHPSRESHAHVSSDVSPNFFFALLQQSTRHTVFSSPLLNCMHARSFLQCPIFLDTGPQMNLFLQASVLF